MSPVRDGEPYKVRFRVLSAEVDVQAGTGAIGIENLIALLRAFVASFGKDHGLDVVGLDPVQVPIHYHPRLGP